MKLKDIVKLNEAVEIDIFEDAQLAEFLPASITSKIKGTLGLNHEKAIIDRMLDLIRENCKDFLSKVDTPLYRGMSVSLKNGVIGKFDAVEHDSRKLGPKYRKLSAAMDSWFVKNFGFAFRTKGVYCTANKHHAEVYSKNDAFIIFPIGHMEYCYSEKVFSIATLPQLFKSEFYDQEFNDTLADRIDSVMDAAEYTTSRSPSSSTQSEIMVLCKQYYAINANSDEAKYIVKKFYS